MLRSVTLCTIALVALSLVTTAFAATEANGEPRLLVLAKAESKLSIIDPNTLEVIARVGTGDSPHEVVSSADGKTAFVSNYGAATPGNSISVIDIASAKETKRIDLGTTRRPHGLAEHGGKIYFTSEFNALVGRIDPAEGAVDLMLGTGEQGTHMLAIDPRDGRIYTTDIFSDTVTMIDPGRGAGGSVAVSHVSVPGGPEGIALSPDGRELWAASRAGAGIAVIDTSADAVVQTIPFEGMPIRLAFTPDGSRVLVSDAKGGRVVAIDARTRQTVGEVKVGEAAIGLLIEPTGERAFVSCMAAHKVMVIDLKTMKVTKEIDAGGAPDGLAWAAERAPLPPPKKPGLFGAQLENVNSDLAKASKLESPGGVLASQVMPGTPAEKGGLKSGDIIITVNGAPILNLQKFMRMISRSTAGDELNIVVNRAGEEAKLKVTLGQRPN